MEFDFAKILMEVIELDASDLHLAVGAAPMVRVRGQLRALDYPEMTAKDTRDIMYEILSNDQRKRLESDWQVDFSYSVPHHGRFRVNADGTFGIMDNWEVAWIAKNSDFSNASDIPASSRDLKKRRRL